MARRADEKVRIGADTAPAERGFAKLTGAGKAAIAAIAAAATAGAVAVSARMIGIFREQERAEIRLRRALVSTGKYTADVEKRLHTLANTIQKTTTTGDEAAQNMIAQFITIGGVAAESMEGATAAALGYAELTGRNVTRVSRTWAKALADLGNEARSSLGELESDFTAAQIEQLRLLKDTEGGAVAQAKAIEFLNQRYGEHAKIVAGSTDVYGQIGNLWGDIKEELGRIVHHLVGPIAEWIRDSLPAWIDGIKDVYVEIVTLGSAWDVLVADMNLALAKMNLEWRRWLDGLISAAVVFGHRLAQNVPFFSSMIPPSRRRSDFTAGAQDSYELALGMSNLARMNQADARRRARAGMVAGGVSTTAGAPGPGGIPGGGGDPADGSGQAARDAAADRLREVQDRERVLRATLRGMSDAVVTYYAEELRIGREAVKATRMLDDEKTRAMGEALLAQLDLERAVNTKKIDEARAAKERAIAADVSIIQETNARRQAAMIHARELERELGIELDAQDREYFIENLRTEEDLERETRQRRMEEWLLNREERVRLEQEYGEREARIRQFFASAELQGAISLYQALAQVAGGGNKKLLKLVKVAEAVRLVALSKVKPAQAYAETSSKYPWPLGPILGAIHAASIYAPLVGALASLKEGGGAGGGTIAGAPSAPPIRDIDGAPVPPGREERRITVEVPVVLDGRNIANVIAEHVALAENE